MGKVSWQLLSSGQYSPHSSIYSSHSHSYLLEHVFFRPSTYGLKELPSVSTSSITIDQPRTSGMLMSNRGRGATGIADRTAVSGSVDPAGVEPVVEPSITPIGVQVPPYFGWSNGGEYVLRMRSKDVLRMVMDHGPLGTGFVPSKFWFFRVRILNSSHPTKTSVPPLSPWEGWVPNWRRSDPPAWILREET